MEAERKGKSKKRRDEENKRSGKKNKSANGGRTSKMDQEDKLRCGGRKGERGREL